MTENDIIRMTSSEAVDAMAPIITSMYEILLNKILTNGKQMNNDEKVLFSSLDILMQLIGQYYIGSITDIVKIDEKEIN